MESKDQIERPMKRRRLNEEETPVIPTTAQTKQHATIISLIPDVLKQLITTFLCLRDHERVARTCTALNRSCKNPSSICPINDVSDVDDIASSPLFFLIHRLQGSKIEWLMSPGQILLLEYMNIRISGIRGHNVLMQLRSWKPRFPVRRMLLGDYERNLHVLQQFDTVHELKLMIDRRAMLAPTRPIATLFEDLKELRTLDLELRSYYELPEDIRLPASLTALRLIVQEMSSFPLWLTQVPLVYLRCSDECLRSICRTTRSLPCIRLRVTEVSLPFPDNFNRTFPHLEVLKFDRKYGQNLAILKDMTLRKLVIYMCLTSRPKSITADNLKFLPATLEKLQLFTCDVSSDLTHLRRLVKLTLLCCNVDIKRLEPLGSLAMLHLDTCTVKNGQCLPVERLEHLTLGHTSNMTIEHILRCQRLRSLQLNHIADEKRYCSMCTADAGAIGKLAQLPLTELRLPDCTLSLANAISIVEQVVPLSTFSLRCPRADVRLQQALAQRHITWK